ncbi:magnesium-translocating P-type ATPase [Fundicoccus sp. Sow4_H7]|uniref:magnesium-translocating P-type ATPase n=1 Tax=Fundicoccus sp. Sow4_H7 TaxID=3438784 RepID=UPI003F90CDA1
MKKITMNYNEIARLTNEQLKEKFDLTHEGYTNEQVEKIREEFGSNHIESGKKQPFIFELLKAYFTPFTLILLVLAVISFITEFWFVPAGEKDLFTVIIILALVFISGTMTLIQSIQSNQASEKLQSMVNVTTSVLRNGQFSEIPINDVVLGDRVQLSAGDMIPADMRLTNTKDLFISQASLTGESYPVEKKAHPKVVKNESTTSIENIAFMGSNVISGSAQGIVIATGKTTLFGQIAEDVASKQPLTNFEIGINKTSMLLVRFMIVMAILVILINGFSKGDWLQAILFGLSIAVGLTPEMLPLIVTSNLVKGSKTMAEEGTIVKNLNAIQNFGAIDVLCTDKTGTLTQDKIVLEYHLNLEGESDKRVLRHAYLNSYYQTGLKNLMDHAVIEAAEKELDIASFKFEKVDEIPFDFVRRRMSVVVEDPSGKTQMITKGAIEEMLSISSFVDYKGNVVELDEAMKEKILKNVEKLNGEGFRVVGVAQKNNPSVIDEFSIKDESEMVLIGYLAFLDPPKASTIEAIKALKEHQVNVKVLTGDNALVTQAVCKQVGINADYYISGDEIEQMSANQLKEAVESCNVFVKLSPRQKATLVETLKGNGHVVGFMGDGINDAPAMRMADVGISVDNAVDIAKESADIILLEKDLMVLEQGIISGRIVFGNIMKYIKITTSSNFGNIFSVLLASIFLPFLPMLPIQLLTLNLIYDISCMVIPWDVMDSDYLYEPKKWKADSISRFMVWFGPVSSIFDILIFIALYFFINPSVLAGNFTQLATVQQEQFATLFQSGWFVFSLWSQTLVLYGLRTEKQSYLESKPSNIFILITSLALVFGSSLPYTILGEHINLTALPLTFWSWMAALVVLYLGLINYAKKTYIRRNGYLL